MLKEVVAAQGREAEESPSTDLSARGQRPGSLQQKMISSMELDCRLDRLALCRDVQRWQDVAGDVLEVERVK
jgi:hypothetical protein